MSKQDNSSNASFSDSFPEELKSPFEDLIKHLSETLQQPDSSEGSNNPFGPFGFDFRGKAPGSPTDLICDLFRQKDESGKRDNSEDPQNYGKDTLPWKKVVKDSSSDYLFELPGVAVEDVTITGTVGESFTVTAKQGENTRNAKIRLEEEADLEKATATNVMGLLTVTIPRIKRKEVIIKVGS